MRAPIKLVKAYVCKKMLLPKSISRNTAVQGGWLIVSHSGISFEIANMAIDSDCLCKTCSAR